MFGQEGREGERVREDSIPNDVFVIEFFEQADLPNGGAWDTLIFSL
jgi:hypothetical protein